MSGIQRIEHHFHHQKAKIGYLTAGDGGIERSLDAALALIEGGITMLELGVPFSDPVADGPVIQRAAERSLQHGTCMSDVLRLARNIRQHSQVPLILFSYLNPIFALRHTDFFDEACASGIDGLLLVDCPREEALDIEAQCLQRHMAPIYVITPSTSRERIQQLDRHGRGFLYYACQRGTTGIRRSLPSDFMKNMRGIKSCVHLPVVTGFGIASLQDVCHVLQEADGVVIGSLFVKALEDGISRQELVELTRSLVIHNEIG